MVSTRFSAGQTDTVHAETEVDFWDPYVSYWSLYYCMESPWMSSKLKLLAAAVGSSSTSGRVMSRVRGNKSETKDWSASMLRRKK